MFIWMPREAPNKEPATPDNAPEKAIRDFAGGRLHWVEPKAGLFKRTFELRCGQEILALMRYERTHWLGARRGLAETTERSWSFRGHWGKVEIDSFEGDCRLTTLECSFWGSGRRLSLPNADDYRWEGRGATGAYGAIGKQPMARRW
jgi:hypothetical protein